MDLKKVIIAGCTRSNDFKTTTTGKSVGEMMGYLDNKDLFYVENNTESLPVIYNRAIDYAIENNADALILLHDDVNLECDPISKLKKLFDQFDVVGVAGTTQAAIGSPALWHLMGGGFQGGNLRGAVAHSEPNGVKYMTSFGPYPARVLLIDGVFMAITKKVMEKVRFDEKNPAKFHFYDMNFCMDAHSKGFKLGVGDIHITHESKGLSSVNNEFKEGESWFLKQWLKA